jgi:hypothetical protein
LTTDEEDSLFADLGSESLRRPGGVETGGRFPRFEAETGKKDFLLVVVFETSFLLFF